MSKTLHFDFGVYEGEVVDGTLRHGWGKLEYSNGNVYEGQWVRGATHGTGVKLYKNGDVYNGRWEAGKRAGKGEYRFAQGHKYKGEYANDSCNGKGTYTTKSGDTYVGEWVDGRKDGHGVETVLGPNGNTVYDGLWHSGKKHGAGRLTSRTGEVVVGRWEADKLVEVEEQTEQEPPVAPVPSAPIPEGVPRATAAQSTSTATAEDDPESPDIGNGLTPEQLEVMEQLGLGPAMASLQDFSSNVTAGISNATSSLDALEAQLEMLTMGLEGMGAETHGPGISSGVEEVDDETEE